MSGARQIRVMAEECPTCIFRPGNLMRLRAGRVREMVTECQRTGGHIPCHEHLGHCFGPGRGAICRGFFDRYDTQSVQLAKRLPLAGLAELVEVAP